MAITTAIFDMDGLLIDSEPLWYEAAIETMSAHGITLSEEEYASSIGLRTRDFLAHWLTIYEVSTDHLPGLEKEITESVSAKIREKGRILPGVPEVIDFFRTRDIPAGLATQSPHEVIDAVMDRTGLKGAFNAVTSAEKLPYGKPHPQVYLDCAALLKALPVSCICFEDSFNGLIAVKAARMTCIVVPAPHQQHELRWEAADLKLESLQEFNEHMFKTVSK
jgi:sugar-phosphatase